MLQSASYIAGALGVCVAAFYYVMNLRNAERDRRKQNILQKLPPISREYWEWNLQIRNSFSGPEEYDKVYRLNPELESKVWYITNIYNVLGQLYAGGMMSLEEIAQAYAPGWIVSWYDMFEFYIRKIRFDRQGEAVYPEFMVPYERLCDDLKRRYPGVVQQQRAMHEELVELRKSQVAEDT